MIIIIKSMKKDLKLLKKTLMEFILFISIGTFYYYWHVFLKIGANKKYNI